MTARRPLATPEQVAEYLVVSINTVYDWRRRRTGPKASKVGIHLRYRWEDVDAWLEKQSAVAA